MSVSGGSCTSMMGSSWYFVSVDSSGIESIPLRTGDVRDRMRLTPQLGSVAGDHRARRTNMSTPHTRADVLAGLTR